MRRVWVWVYTIGRVPEAYRSTGMQGEWCGVYIRRCTAFVFTALVNQGHRNSKLSRLTLHNDYNSAEEIKTGTTELAQCCVGHSCASTQLSFFL